MMISTVVLALALVIALAVLATASAAYRRQIHAIGLAVRRIREASIPGAPATTLRPLTASNVVPALTALAGDVEALSWTRELVLEAASEAILALDQEGRILFANAAALAVTGRSRGDLIGRLLHDLLHAGDPRLGTHTRGECPPLRTLTEGALGPIEDVVYRHGRSPVVVTYRTVSIAAGAGRAPLIGVAMSDQTSRKLAHARLDRAQHAEVVSRLIGGVAHDLANVLTVVLTYGEFMLSEAQPGSRREQILREVVTAGQRGSALARQLRGLGKGQLADRRTVSVNVLLAEEERAIRRVLGDGVNLELRREAGIGLVTVDPAQIQQMVTPLLLNARQAMAQGGTLTVSTANVHVDGTVELPGQPIPAGDYVAITVADTGPGVAPELGQRIFEPFFTTRASDQAIGLGLTSARSLARLAGGDLILLGSTEAGSTFRIFLPRASSSEIEAATEAGIEMEGRGQETILVVEDELAVRETVGRCLEGAGYRVIAAPGPQEAIELARRLEQPIDLMLTDVMMPGMTGHRLAERMASLRPSLKVVFMSGYTDEAIVGDDRAGPTKARLLKPFTAAALKRKVRQVLDGRPVAA